MSAFNSLIFAFYFCRHEGSSCGTVNFSPPTLVRLPEPSNWVCLNIRYPQIWWFSDGLEFISPWWPAMGVYKPHFQVHTQTFISSWLRSSTKIPQSVGQSFLLLIKPPLVGLYLANQVTRKRAKWSSRTSSSPWVWLKERQEPMEHSVGPIFCTKWSYCAKKNEDMYCCT